MADALDAGLNLWMHLFESCPTKKALVLGVAMVERPEREATALYPQAAAQLAMHRYSREFADQGPGNKSRSMDKSLTCRVKLESDSPVR